MVSSSLVLFSVISFLQEYIDVSYACDSSSIMNEKTVQFASLKLIHALCDNFIFSTNSAPEFGWELYFLRMVDKSVL